MIKLLTFIAMVLGMAILIGIGLIIMTAPFAWMGIAFMAYCRPCAVLARAAICFLAVWIVAVLLLPAGNGAVMGMLLAIFVAPVPARCWASWAVFRADEPSRREMAAQVRNRDLERNGSGKRVSADKRWRGYVIDAERAERRGAYALPSALLN